LPGNKNTVIVGMSGGVDSSVAALLLRKEYNVIGISLQVFDYSPYQDCDLKGVCCSPEDVYDARQVADQLNIPFYVLNYRDRFQKTVIDNFLSEYIKGRTPNPCVICNEKIKFGEMLKFAHSVGADYIATGHYAIIEKSNSSYMLKKGVDRKKDQSYFLYRLKPEILKNILFPLGYMTKEEVKRIAKESGLRVHNKRESHEICFVPNNDYTSFIEKNINEDFSGRIVDIDGKTLGRHRGIFKYTIGQRRGLNISSTRPLYVIDINPDRKEVIVGDESELFHSEFTVESTNLISPHILLEKGIEIRVKIRYMSEEVNCEVNILNEDMLYIKTSKPIRAITRGQSAVLYHKDIVIGGGIIKEIVK
jgi:tRNA-specific 2-thiouridylase